jgi:glycosyltransferase involved in cell wall biosynthesis
MTAVMMTHIEPVLHGQAMMASLLRDHSQDWKKCKLISINAAYVDRRSDFGGFGLSKIFKMMHYTRLLLNQVKANHADSVIVTQSFFPAPFLKDAFIVLALSFFTSVKIITWVHMDPSRLGLENKSVMFQKFAYYIFSKIDLFVGCSPSVTSSWPKWIAKDKVVNVPNGIPHSNALVDRSGREKCTVLFLSAMDPEKGWRELFEVAEKICDQFSDAIFIFRGGISGAETKENAESVFAQSRHVERIKWLGLVDGEEKVVAFQEADIFCLPSWTEAFPIAVLEAMSFGLPVIATCVGGIPDAIEEGCEGWLFTPKNQDELQRALVNAISVKAERLQRGAAAYKKYTQHFTDNQFSHRWENLLQKLVA